MQRARDWGDFVRTAALVVAATFLVVGVLGFVPGIVTGYGDLRWAGPHSEAELLGIFDVSVLHNLVHLGFGVAGLFLARHAGSAVGYLLGGGLLYGFVFLFGIGVDRHSDANFLPVDGADNWLHLVLAVGMLAMGVLGYRSQRKPGHLHAPVETTREG